MPLDPNAAGGTWPPKHMDRVSQDLIRWSAWFSGDPEQLTRAYGGYGGGYSAAENSFQQDGLLGAARRTIQRMFWGQPPRQGEQRSKLHVPIAAEIAQVSADLLFGQPPTITIPGAATDGDEKPDPVALATQERLDALLGEQAHTTFHESAESGAALGMSYLVAGWDRDVDPTGPLLSAVDADAAFPFFAYGRLQDVTFVREWAEASQVLRHMELHERGVIWHSAWIGDHTHLGRSVPLDAHPQTAGLMQDGMVADDQRTGSGVPTGIDRLDVVAISNGRSRTWRNLPGARDLGRADISGVELELDALDDVWSSWMRDVRHGRSRIHVPQHMLETRGPGKGGIIDIDRELYVGLVSPPDGPLQLESTQFAIRYQEHQATAQALIERIVTGCGYSPQTFGLDSNTRTAMTAMESWAKQVRTQNTRNAKIRRWRQGLIELAAVMVDIDRAQFKGKGNPDLVAEVHFAEAVAESQLARAQTVQLLRAAEAASTETIVAALHPDWDAELRDDEVQRINAERGTAPDPMSMFGGLNQPDGSTDAGPSGVAPAAGTVAGRQDDLDWGLFG